MITKDGYNRLLHFLIWCIVGFIIAIIGISNVFASEHDMGYYSNSTSVYLSVPAAQADIYLPRDTYNSAGMFDIVYVHIQNISVNSNYVYQMEFSTPAAHLDNANAAVAVQYVNNGVNQGCNVLGVDDITSGYPKIYFQCKSSFTNGTMIFSFYDINGNTSGLTNNPNNFKWGYTYMRYYDDATDIDWGPITTNANANTDRIIANDNANANSIMNNYNQKSTQDTRDIVNGAHSDANSIKNNQNANTDKTIKSQEVCTDIIYNYSSLTNYTSGKILNSSGDLINQSYWRVSDYIKIDRDILVTTKSAAASASLCFYTESKTLISCIVNNNMTVNENLTIPSNAYYFRASFSSNNPIFKSQSCKNGNQALNDSINGLNNSLNDDNVDDNGIASAYEDFNEYLDDNSTITQLLTLPITLYTAILNNLNGSCSPFNLGELYGEDLILPCINISQYLGSSLWSMIDIIISGFAVYAIAKKMIKVFNNFSSLREGDVIDD